MGIYFTWGYHLSLNFTHKLTHLQFISLTGVHIDCKILRDVSVYIDKSNRPGLIYNFFLFNKDIPLLQIHNLLLHYFSFLFLGTILFYDSIFLIIL